MGEHFLPPIHPPEIISAENNEQVDQLDIIHYNLCHWLRILAENPAKLINQVLHLKDLTLAACSGSSELATMIAAEMCKKIDHVYLPSSEDPTVRAYPDGELAPKFHPETQLRKKYALIIQSFSPVRTESNLSINDQLMELLFTIRAADSGSAKEITAVLPYFPYARSDRKELPKKAIGAKLVCDFLRTAGAYRLVSVDPHKDQIAGFTDKPFDIVYSSELFIPLIKKKFGTKNIVLIAIDGGGEKMVRAWSRRLLGHDDIGFVTKTRNHTTTKSTSHFYRGPELAGKIGIIVDDMIASGGSLMGAAKVLNQESPRMINAIAPHGLFLNPALENIKNSSISHVWTTNTIQPRPEVLDSEKTGGKITVYNIAPLLADKLTRVHDGRSMEID